MAARPPTTSPTPSRHGRLAHDHRDHRAPIGAERDANADLVAPPLDHVRHHAVETDRRQQPGEQPKNPDSVAISRSRSSESRTSRFSVWNSRIAPGCALGDRRGDRRRERRERRARSQHDLKERVRSSLCCAAGRNAIGVNSSRRSVYFASFTSPTIW